MNNTKAKPVSVSETAHRYLSARARETGRDLILSLKAGGCSGFSYDLQPYDPGKGVDCESAVDLEGGLRLLIDRSSLLFLIGTVIETEDGILRSGLRFRNPLETARCGCGESIAIDPSGRQGMPG